MFPGHHFPTSCALAYKYAQSDGRQSLINVRTNDDFVQYNYCSVGSTQAWPMVAVGALRQWEMGVIRMSLRLS